MNDLFTVMKFTMKEMMTRKSFIISTIVILVMIVIGCNIPNIIKNVSSENSNEKIIILDKDNLYEDRLDELNDLELGYDITISDESIDEIREKVDNDEYNFGIVVEPVDSNNIKLILVVSNVLFIDGISSELENSLTTLYKDIKLEKLNLTYEEKVSINPMFTYDIVASSSEVKGNIPTMMILSLVLFYAVFFCAYQVSSSITTEKTSKIIETLVTSTSPKNIVLGKTIGVGVVGLCQLILILITAVISAKIFMPKEIIDVLLDTSTLTISLGIITLLYFILGYFTFSLLYALTGSTVSKPEDIQSANSPVAIMSVAGFYLAYFSMLNPTSNLNVFATLFPLSSPFCMPFRIMMSLATTKDVVLSILILIVTILVIAKVTIKIYSNAILNYGTKTSLRDIIKMYKQK